MRQEVQHRHRFVLGKSHHQDTKIWYFPPSPMKRLRACPCPAALNASQLAYAVFHWSKQYTKNSHALMLPPLNRVLRIRKSLNSEKNTKLIIKSQQEIIQ